MILELLLLRNLYIMQAKISKAQTEVWEWKEKLYEELKNIPSSERIGYLMKKAHATVAAIKKKRELKKGS